jgi:signal transduction histidine kinase
MAAIKKAQLDLAHAAGRAFGQLKEGLFEADLDYQLLLINDFGARLAGFEDALSCLEHGLNLADLFVDPADLQTILGHLETHESLDGYVCRMFDIHRNEKWIESTINVLRDDAAVPVGYWGVFRDLTERREAEAAHDALHAKLVETLERLELSERMVRKQNAVLEDRNRNLRDYTAAVTHDLRAPLSAVKGFAEMLRDLTAGQLDPRSQRILERIGFNCEQMERIISGLLELVLSSEESEPPAWARLDQVFAGVVENRREEIARLGAVMTAEPGLPPVWLQPTKLYQLIDNLVSNALKHLGSVAAPRVRLGWRASAAAPAAAEVVYFVEDNGRGVEPIHRERIFEMFYRADRSVPGVGLGLSIVQRLAALHGGSVWVEPVAGGGARFCFSLPDARSSETAPPEQPRNPSP